MSEKKPYSKPVLTPLTEVEMICRSHGWHPQHLGKYVAAGVAAERERCARICENASSIFWGQELAAAIRAQKGSDHA